MTRMAVWVLGAVTVLTGCQQLMTNRPSASETRAADEKTLRDTDGEFSKAAAAKDLEKVLSYYSDDATVLSPNAPMAMGKPNIRTAWTAIMAMPGLALTWAPIKVEASGELGYTMGTYSMSFNDPAGKATQDHGKYVEVWKKQSDGTWKVVSDIYNSDVPTPPAPSASGPA